MADCDAMRLAVFGASGPTGLQVVRQALAAGHDIVAVTRRPTHFPIRAVGLKIACADVGDASAVDRVLAAARAHVVISTFGVPYTRRPIHVYSRGIRSILDAMAAHGVGRLVCVSSTTVAVDDAPGETLWWRHVVIPLLRNVVGRTLYDDMARMEAIVRASACDWTIVRPGGLFDTQEPTGALSVAMHRLRGRFTSRADLASALIVEATTASAHRRAVVEAITQSTPPPPLTFVREAFGRGR